MNQNCSPKSPDQLVRLPHEKKAWNVYLGTGSTVPALDGAASSSSLPSLLEMKQPKPINDQLLELDFLEDHEDLLPIMFPISVPAVGSLVHTCVFGMLHDLSDRVVDETSKLSAKYTAYKQKYAKIKEALSTEDWEPKDPESFVPYEDRKKAFHATDALDQACSLFIKLNGQTFESFDELCSAIEKSKTNPKSMVNEFSWILQVCSSLMNYKVRDEDGKVRHLRCKAPDPSLNLSDESIKKLEALESLDPEAADNFLVDLDPMVTPVIEEDEFPQLKEESVPDYDSKFNTIGKLLLGLKDEDK